MQTMTKADTDKYRKRYYLSWDKASLSYKVHVRRKSQRLKGIALGGVFFATWEQAQDEADKLNSL